MAVDDLWYLTKRGPDGKRLPSAKHGQGEALTGPMGRPCGPIQGAAVRAQGGRRPVRRQRSRRPELGSVHRRPGRACHCGDAGRAVTGRPAAHREDGYPGGSRHPSAHCPGDRADAGRSGPSDKVQAWVKDRIAGCWHLPRCGWCTATSTPSSRRRCAGPADRQLSLRRHPPAGD